MSNLNYTLQDCAECGLLSLRACFKDRDREDWQNEEEMKRLVELALPHLFQTHTLKFRTILIGPQKTARTIVAPTHWPRTHVFPSSKKFMTTLV